jgi:hypothetical protein
MWIDDPDTALLRGQIKLCQSGLSSCGYACGFSVDACCVVSWRAGAVKPRYWCLRALSLGHFLFPVSRCESAFPSWATMLRDVEDPAGVYLVFLDQTIVVCHLTWDDPGNGSSDGFVSPICLAGLSWSGAFLSRKSVHSVVAIAVIMSPTRSW